MKSSYLKVAGIDGIGPGSTVDWAVDWSGNLPAPNVFPRGNKCLITNESIVGQPYHTPNPGVLTLTPTVTCGEESVELDPIVLNVEVDFVPMDWQCPPCYGYDMYGDPSEPDPSEGVILILEKPVDGAWVYRYVPRNGQAYTFNLNDYSQIQFFAHRRADDAHIVAPGYINYSYVDRVGSAVAVDLDWSYRSVTMYKKEVGNPGDFYKVHIWTPYGGIYVTGFV